MPRYPRKGEKYMNEIFKTTSLILIDEEGNVICLPRKEGEKYHSEAYLRLNELVPGLLDGYPQELSTSAGYELANHTAAGGRVIIWPSDLINPANAMTIITLPKPILNNQSYSLMDVLPQLKGSDFYAANTANYNKGNLATPTSESLNTDGTYESLMHAIIQFIQVSQELNSLSQKLDSDIRKK